MTDPESFAAALLLSEGYAAFEYLGEGNARVIGRLPPFLSGILGEAWPSADCIRPGDSMPFLENFLIEAESFWSLQRQGRVESGTWVEKAADGREVPLEAAALWADGRRVLLVRHLESRYAAEQKVLQTARDSLLEHERLVREIQKKEILLHCIIHDLSQPLTAMRGCFSVLGLEPLPEKLKTLVEIGQRQTRNQEAMIRGVLEAFSSELAAEQPFQDVKDAPDLARCAAGIVKDYLPAFANQGARIQADPAMDASKSWAVVGDEPRLRRIFTNLVENALRYSPAGTTVTLGAEDDGDYARAYVDDEGPGLPDGEAPTRMFALFAKGKNSGGKAGLGLYFCRITVERWGGAIGCEPRREKGTRFWFRLPRAQSMAPRREEGGVAQTACAAMPLRENPAASPRAAPEPAATRVESSPKLAEQAGSANEPAAARLQVALVSQSSAAAGLLARVGGNARLARALARAYLAGSAGRMAAIRASAAQGDAEALGSAVSNLLGALRNLEGHKLAPAARRLAAKALAGHWEGVDELCRDLEAQVAQLDAFLRAFAAENSGEPG